MQQVAPFAGRTRRCRRSGGTSRREKISFANAACRRFGCERNLDNRLPFDFIGMTPDAVGIDGKVPRAVQRLSSRCAAVEDADIRESMLCRFVTLRNNRLATSIQRCAMAERLLEIAALEGVDAGTRHGRCRLHRQRHHRSTHCGRSHGCCLRQSCRKGIEKPSHGEATFVKADLLEGETLPAHAHNNESRPSSTWRLRRSWANR